MVELLRKSFDNLTLRVHGTFESPLYCAQDIETALGLSNIRENLRKLDDDEKITQVSESLTAGLRAQNMVFVTESGLYKLMFWCNKAKKRGTPAYRFLNWVVRDVVPSIRQTGTYRLEQRLQDMTDRLVARNEQLIVRLETLRVLGDRFRFSPFKTALLECGITYSFDWKTNVTDAQHDRFWTVWGELKTLDIVYQPDGDTNSNYESRFPLATFRNNVQLILANL